MNYREIEWCGYHWRTQERWGDRHQNHLKQVRDGNMIKENEDGSISLYISKNKDGDYSTGMLSLIEELGYGTYSLEVKLPKGNNLWPSFWMWSYDSWPPEIDVFEGYSETVNYGNGKLLHKICPNVHYGDTNETHKVHGACNTLGVLTKVNEWNKYTLIYKKKFILILYNNIPVYFVAKKEVMKCFNKHEMQNVIINTGVSKEFTDVDLRSLTEPMLIRNFKYKK